ncbi:MAG: tRNA lysidine(34) synthetase TilS, partial [Oscillospiraceae bacterium]
ISVNILYDEILGKNIQKRTKKISLQIICYKDYADFQKIYKNLLIFALDYDTIIGKLIFRQKIDGDQMKLSQGNGTKTLKKWYQEKKLTPLQRQTALVICDQQGILGAEHIGVDRRAALTEKTVNVLQIIIEKEEKSQE